MRGVRKEKVSDGNDVNKVLKYEILKKQISKNLNVTM